MNNTNIKIGKRLTAAAKLCRKGSFIADVGTDHAYLPIYLLGMGHIRGGVVSDINKGPIERARAHISEHGAADKLVSVQCDGLSSLECFAPEDIFILGMGGELIARIIADAPFTRKAGVRLILQPMTHPEILRGFLAKNGYDIIDEVLVKEEKIYQITVAEYSGVQRSYNDLELMFGKKNIEAPSPILFELLDRTVSVLRDRIAGKERAGADASWEKAMISQIGEIK